MSIIKKILFFEKRLAFLRKPWYNKSVKKIQTQLGGADKWQNATFVIKGYLLVSKFLTLIDDQTELGNQM